MTGYRKVPKLPYIHVKDEPISLKSILSLMKYLLHSPVTIPLAVVILWFVLTIIGQESTNSGSRSLIDQIIFYGLVDGPGIILLIGLLSLAWINKPVGREGRKEWKKVCKCSELTILERIERHIVTGIYDDGYDGSYMLPDFVELETNSDQRAVYPYDTIVYVQVSEPIYRRLKRCPTVRIYYMPEDPWAFLLEDECQDG